MALIFVLHGLGPFLGPCITFQICPAAAGTPFSLLVSVIQGQGLFQGHLL